MRLLITLLLALLMCSCANSKETTTEPINKMYSDTLVIDSDDNMEQAIFNLWNQR